MCAFVFAVFRGERVALLELDHALCSQDILGLLSSIRLYEVSFLLQRVLERDEALCSYTRARVARSEAPDRATACGGWEGIRPGSKARSTLCDMRTVRPGVGYNYD
jgi:hypothetical protein